jgi:hypothetical protein
VSSSMRFCLSTSSCISVVIYPTNLLVSNLVEHTPAQKHCGNLLTPRSVRILLCSSSKRWLFCVSYVSSSLLPEELDVGGSGDDIGWP